MWNTLCDITRQTAILQRETLECYQNSLPDERPHREFFDIKQAAEYTTLSPTTLRNLIKSEKIAYCKRDGRVVFYIDDLRAFILASRVKTGAEKEADFQREADSVYFNRGGRAKKSQRKAV
jgi:hypothetical protein